MRHTGGDQSSMSGAIKGGGVHDRHGLYEEVPWLSSSSLLCARAALRALAAVAVDQLSPGG